MGRKKELLLYKPARRRVNFRQVNSREAAPVVKGTNRRVIVVKSPDPRIFEEAIFIIKEEYMRRGGSMEQMLEEARRAAGEYVGKNTARPGLLRPLGKKGTLLAAGGALAAGVVWMLTRLVI